MVLVTKTQVQEVVELLAAREKAVEEFEAANLQKRKLNGMLQEFDAFRERFDKMTNGSCGVEFVIEAWLKMKVTEQVEDEEALETASPSLKELQFS